MTEPGPPLGARSSAAAARAALAHTEGPLFHLAGRACRLLRDHAARPLPLAPPPRALGSRRARGAARSLAPAPPPPAPAPAGGANAALRCSQGGGWKFEPLLGEELDLRRITWRLPPELIPRLSASSGRSSDGEAPRGPPDHSADAGAGGEGGGATPGPPGGDGPARAP